MSHVLMFGRRHTRLLAALGTALLAPPLACWLAVALVVVANLRPAAMLLGSIEARGGLGAEVLILLACPLAAVALGFTAIRRVPRRRRATEAWCWTIIGVGVLCAVCAVLASS